MNQNWQEKATTLNFKGELEMFQELYKTMSLQDMAKSFKVSVYLIRKKLHEHKIDVRGRGGPNGQKVEMTLEIIEAMKTKGSKAVALELGVSPYTLFKQKAKFLRDHPPTEELPSPPVEPSAPAVVDPIEG